MEKAKDYRVKNCDVQGSNLGDDVIERNHKLCVTVVIFDDLEPNFLQALFIQDRFCFF